MKNIWVPALILMSASAFAQTATPPAPAQPPMSLADRARMLRDQKATTTPPKATRTFNNDNLPKTGAITVSGEHSVADASDKAADAKDEKDAKDGKSKDGKKDDKAAAAEDEAKWRGQFAKLREKLETETRRLDVLQRELNLAQIQSYADPNVALREQFQRTELTKRTAEIEAQKATVEDAKKALADLTEEARSAGAPPAWALAPAKQ